MKFKRLLFFKAFLFCIFLASLFPNQAKAQVLSTGTSLNATLEKILEYPFKLSFIWLPELGPSPALGDVDPLSPGLEIVTGNREYYPFYDEGNFQILGRWFMFKSNRTLAWWKNTENDEARSSVVLSDLKKEGKLLIVGGTTSGNQVQVLDKDGNFVWRFICHGINDFAFYSTPGVAEVVPGGSLEVAAGSLDGHVHLINGDTGEEIWRYQTGSPIVSSVAMDDLDQDGKVELVVGVVGSSGSVVCLTNQGKLLWRFVPQSGKSFFSSPAIFDLDGDGTKEVIIGGLNGRLYALDGKTGAVKWSYLTGSRIYSSPAVGDLDSDGKMEIVFGSSDTYVYSLSHEGNLKWRTKTNGPVHSSPALARRMKDSRALDVYVGSDDGFLYLLRGKDGAVLDKFKASWKISASPAVADVDGDGKLEIAFQDRYAESGFGEGDAGYGYGDRFWLVRDLSSNVSPFQLEWPMFRANPEHTGVYSQPIVIVDDVPPTIDCSQSAPLIVEATSPSGAVVNFSKPTVTDNVDTNPSLTCNPDSGSTFSLGSTTITCTAKDASGNLSQCSFLVKVQDTTPPISKILSPPANSTLQDSVVISGTAADIASAVKQVELQIFNKTISKYWNGSDWTDSQIWILTNGANSWSYTFSALTGGHSYLVMSRATDNSLNVETPSDGLSFQAFYLCPQPVRDLTATPLPGRKIELSWAGSPTPGIISYKIYMGNESLNLTNPLATVSGEITRWVFENLISGVSYKFVVRAVHKSGCEEKNSNIVSATAFDSPPCLSAQIKSPHNGRKVSGERITVVAETRCENSQEVSQVRFEYKAASENDQQWKLIPAANSEHSNPDLTFPYFVHWNVNSLANGEVHLRAVAVNAKGQSDPAPAFITILVDHHNPDLQVKIDEKGHLDNIEKVENHKTNQVIVSDKKLPAPAQLIIPPDALTQAETKVSVKLKPENSAKQNGGIKPAGIEIEIKLQNGQSQLGAAATLVLPYLDENKDGFVDGTALHEQDLAIYYFNPKKEQWEKMADSKVNSSNKTVSAKTNHFSLFGLFASAKDKTFVLKEVYAYPNPAKQGKNPTIHIEAGLADQADIQIYDISGQLIHSHIMRGEDLKIVSGEYAFEYLWDVSTVSSGIYLVSVSVTKVGEGTFKKNIKVAIVK